MEQQYANTQTRIKWIDIFKGIMIFLVVIGHATGTFNSWIYQFHMTAFFFASGYLSDIEKNNGVYSVIKKIESILFPFFFISFFSFAVNGIISRTGLHEILFGMPYIGFGNSVKELVIYGNNYAQYLGTFWFLAALFGTELLQICLVNICGRNINVVIFLISTILYGLGYYFILTGINTRFGIFDFSIIFVAQIYYLIGAIIRKISIKIYFSKEILAYFLYFSVALVISIWGKQNGIVMDLASKNVHYPFAEIIVALASISIITMISIKIDEIIPKAGNIIAFVGKNSLGIMIFHFAFFKCCFMFFYSMGYLSITDLSLIVLPTGAPAKLWIPMSIVSLIGSIVLWIIIKRIPIIRFLIGQDKKSNEWLASKINHWIKPNIKVTEAKGCFSKQWNYIRELNFYGRANLLCTICLIVIVAIPFFRCGVIVNDELQARSLSMQGFMNFYKTNFSSYIYDGRPLGAIVDSFTMYIGFIGKGNAIIFKFFQVCTLIFECALFACFVNKLVKNKVLGFLAGVISFCFFPIAFEHMSPNAFVCLLGIPFILLLVSLIMYIESINHNNMKQLILSMILLFIAEMSYETFVTYSVLYLLISLLKYGRECTKHKKFIITPIITSLVYLCLYIMGSKIFTSGYSGNQIQFVSLKNSLDIIVNLFIVSFPGIFVAIPRYQYFKTVFNNLSGYDYVRIFVTVALFTYVCLYAFTTKQSSSADKTANKKEFCIIIGGILYMILPSLPIAISSMYQGNVGKNGFLTLPITHYEYFASVFVIVYGLWIINMKISGNFYLFSVLIMTLLLANVQQMNDIFSYEQASNYRRLLKIEKFLDTETARSLKNSVYYAHDLYKQQNALAIHDGYWTSFCDNNLGYKLQLTNELSDRTNGAIFFEDDNFIIVNNKETVILSFDEETGAKAVPTGNDLYELFYFHNPQIDNNFYIYKNECENNTFLSTNYEPLFGVYEDGWLQKKSEFLINTGKIGVIKLNLYYPGKIDESKIVKIYVDDNLYSEYVLKDALTELEIYSVSLSVVNLKIECNFEITDKGADTRELSMILSSLTLE